MSTENAKSEHEQILLVDAAQLAKDLRRIEQRKQRGQAVDRLQARVEQRVQQSHQQWRRRQALVPGPIKYPENLPVSARREDLYAAIRDHQVVILAGETGSGKTTQLPKICLEIGRGVAGMIGHTQPRRIAAQAVSARLAGELGVGNPIVGHQIRFQDHSSADTLIKLMTDGILLMEIQRDRDLLRYDTLIIDEAHERSLNIDFLLGYLKHLLPRRPDLRVVVTSATIDVKRFSRFFNDAPIIEVSGRSYPVEVRYKPPGEDRSLSDAIVDSVQEVISDPCLQGQARDILVFHSGEREIRETSLALRRAGYKHDQVLPLYSRLSQAEQGRVLKSRAGGGRRIVLATNVAETSLTVPGIVCVIDPGMARISRYSVRSKVQQLPIEPISQASANQRMGRCGRISDGLCVRLYDEDDFNHRHEFTEPEIKRTNLAAVILQMHLLGLGNVQEFPFLEPPELRQINDGVGLLEELQALKKGRLTAIGQQLARLPVDPRIGRMLLAAGEQGALQEVLVIASFMSIQDPRERPADKQQAADQQHARFRDPESDYIAILNLWSYFEKQRQALSSNALRKLCGREFLSSRRMHEWREIHRQLRLQCRDLGLTSNTATADYAALHKSLLVGLLTNIGVKLEGREFEGVRNRRFYLHPSSSLHRKPPKWLVCAELVETTRLYGRLAASIEPEWVVAAAANLIRREYYEPAWRQRTGRVMARERIRLFGLVLTEGKFVNYAPMNHGEARRLFIRSALVEGNYRSKQAFWQHNKRLLDELADLEARGRRRDLVVEEDAIELFYDDHLPETVCDHPSLEKALRKGGKALQQSLQMARAFLLRFGGHDVTESQFPRTLATARTELTLEYRFEPGSAEDGVTAVVPLLSLNSLRSAEFEWLVPGLLRDKCIALLKLLPKPIRRQLVPIPDCVDEMLGELDKNQIGLRHAMARWLSANRRIEIRVADWDDATLEDFYRMRFRVVDATGSTVGAGRNLEQLQHQHSEAGEQRLQRAAAHDWQRTGITEWDFGELPDTVSVDGVDAWPALVPEGEQIELRLFGSPETARDAHQAGVVLLLMLALKKSLGTQRRHCLKDKTLLLRFRGRFTREQLLNDVLQTAVLTACVATGEFPRSADSFEAAVHSGRAKLAATVSALEMLVTRIGDSYSDLAAMLTQRDDPLFIESVTDVREQIDELLPEGFLMQTREPWRSRLPVYLQAAAERLQRLPDRLPRDLEWTWEMQQLAEQYQSLMTESRQTNEKSLEFPWLLQEYRISLFAQQLGTSVPVSRKRLEKHLRDSVDYN